MTPNAETTADKQRKRVRKLRRRLILGAVVVVILAALVLTPPYVNVNRYRRRITSTMSQSLGRPVHLDNVTLHLLTVPGLTLSNLVVSEDPAFGYEPVIRANVVEASLRVGSLWRRQIEFSSIRFIDPSVNLVRSPDGRWNLEDVLMQASRVETAPTVQPKAGPAPRFPYIEATGARLNVKLGNEKIPLSLTETQFALWLPSPQMWRVRLRGKPTRTDSNVSQAGEISLEGTLQHAQTMAAVPLDIRVSWNDAPLGEASRLLTGNDAGWRGTGFAEGHVIGLLSNASVSTHVQLNDLRRADFVPAQSLDITIDCKSTADVARATLNGANCVVPVGDAKPLTISAASVDLEKVRLAEATANVKALPLAWASDWIKLFVAEIPPSFEPKGEVDGELKWNSSAGSWQGPLDVRFPASNTGSANLAGQVPANTPEFDFTIDTAPVPNSASPTPIARLAPVSLQPSPASKLTLSGVADANGYGLQLNGVATNAQVLELANTLPPLNQGVEAAFTPASRTAGPHAIALSCSRLWGGAQACVTLAPATTQKPTRTRRWR